MGSTTNTHQYKGIFFTLGESHGETVILPTKFMEELKDRPDYMLNLDDEIDEVSYCSACPEMAALTHCFSLKEIPFQIQLVYADLSGGRHWNNGCKRKESAYEKPWYEDNALNFQHRPIT